MKNQILAIAIVSIISLTVIFQGGMYKITSIKTGGIYKTHKFTGEVLVCYDSYAGCKVVAEK